MHRQLVIVAGPETGRTFPLEDGQTLVIGRGLASHTKINDPHISRIHCRVQVDGGKTLLVDEGSDPNSVRLNQVIADYLAAVASGSAPDRNALIERSPDLADELRSFFRDHDRMKAVSAGRDVLTVPPPPSAAGSAVVPPDTVLD